MTASYRIITGVDDTVTAVVARCRISSFSERVHCPKMSVDDECESTGGVAESRSRQPSPPMRTKQ
jgi:hypothetical protein